MQSGEWISKRAAAVCLAAIVIGSTALAVRWAFLVPIFQSPDEPPHLEYALALRDGGRLGVEPPPPTDTARFVHPWVTYLVERSRSETVQFNPGARVEPGYGTRSFYRKLDREAPPIESVRVYRPPVLATVYPYGYYITLAAWLKLVGLFSSKVTVMFFAARIFSSLLLAVSLVTGYLAARELKIGRGTALVVTAIIGLFPLTSFVASYVQPDNLSFALVSLSLWLAMRAARRGAPWIDLAVLGLILGWLLVTKPHFLVCVSAATFPLLALRLSPWRWPVAILLLTWSWLPMWMGYTWLLATNASHYSSGAPYVDFVPQFVDRINRTFLDYFRGTTHMSFWGLFGLLDTPIEMGTPPRLAVVARFLEMAGTWLVLGLTLIRLERIASRLWRVARRGHYRAAVRVAVSDPVMNTYFLFFALMIYAYVRMDNRFGAQGRNWLPVMLAVILTAVRFAPRALTLKGTQKVVSATLTVLLLAYVAGGSVYGPRAIKKRFYLPPANYEVRHVPLPETPALLHKVTWADRKGRTEGADAMLMYKLPRAEPVRMMEVCLKIDNPQHQTAILHLIYANSRQPQPPTPEHLRTFCVPVGPRERRLFIPINETIDTIRIDPDVRPCEVEITSIVLHQPVRRLASRK